MERYADRHAAGRSLAPLVARAVQGERPIVVGLPRGGVPVAFEVASALHASLDVLAVRKLGVPGHEELAFGAIASGGVRVLNDGIVRSTRLRPHVVDAITERERRVLQGREARWRRGTARSLAGATVVLVDDGLATGATMLAAVAAARAQGARRVVVAVPVGARDSCALLERAADEVVCPWRPEPFMAVGLWYADFLPTSDEEVARLLERLPQLELA